MKTRCGAHVSVSKGLVRALEKASEMGASCIQIFSSPPQSFIPPKFTDSECSEFKTQARKLDIQPIFIHAKYLINLASEKESLQTLSIKSLIADLTFAEKIGAQGVIVHTGSHKGKGFNEVLPVVVESIKQILEKTPASTTLYLEVASGGKGKIGSTFEELHAMLDGVGNSRVGVCLDTAHLFAAGYAFDALEKVVELAKQIEKKIGWATIECMHANDSKVEFKSGKDRHENIGQGFIGKDPFRLLLQHPKFNNLPFILETPGFDDKGPDKKNLDILKSLI